MNRSRSRCLVVLVAFTVVSSFMVMKGSLLNGVLISPQTKGSSKTATTTAPNTRQHRLFRRYMEDKCDGKENILNILQQNIDTTRCKVSIRPGNMKRQHHVFGMTTCRLEDLCQQLPQWKQIKNSYGSLPTIIGVNSCSPIQSSGGSSAIHITGLFANAGGDLLETTLKTNYPNLRVQNLNYTAAIKLQTSQEEDVLRVVVVRDPFRWMAAMCQSSQGVSWIQAPKHHCPNLVPSGEDTALAKRLKTYTVTTPSGHRYRSLADLWTAFYKPYLNEDFVKTNRILLVRYEDVLYHLESVLDSVLACTGDVTTLTETAKLPYSAVAEMTQRQKRARYAGMTTDDMVYAKKAIPAWMLQQLQYRPIPTV